jgi:hypothetical protein
MAPFLVTFKSWRGSGDSRREQTLSQIDVADRNRVKLLDFIETAGLRDQIGSVASPTLIGAIGVVMTPVAAERIATMDGVVKVIRAS